MYKNKRSGLYFDPLQCEMPGETILNRSYLEKGKGIAYSKVFIQV